MKVTYIYHSSFLVELDSVNLLFDYYKGKIPVMDCKKPLIVFASHAHGDHFSKKIFELGDLYENIHYVLSDDINIEAVPSQCKNNVLFVNANGTWESEDIINSGFINIGTSKKMIVNKEIENKKIKIETFRSTDEGVAFWICCEGKTIYHAGDLHFWFWKEEGDDWNQMIANQYHAEIEKLRGRHANLAFLVLDPRQEEDFYLGMNDFMKVVSVDHIVPMHCWGDYSVIPKMKALDCSMSYREQIAEIEKEGDTFEWNN